jgi:hypothetical protein
MRELLAGKGTISLLDCSAENAPNTDLYLYLYAIQDTENAYNPLTCKNFDSNGAKIFEHPSMFWLIIR